MYGKKKHLKKLRLAADTLLKTGTPYSEQFHFYLPGKLAPVKVTGERVINHYRRMKRLMINQKINPEQTITLYKTQLK